MIWTTETARNTLPLVTVKHQGVVYENCQVSGKANPYATVTLVNKLGVVGYFEWSWQAIARHMEQHRLGNDKACLTT